MGGFFGLAVMLCLLKYSEAQLTFTSPGTGTTAAGGTVAATAIAETSDTTLTLFTVTAASGTGPYTYTFATGGNPSDVASTTITAGAVKLATGKSIDFEATTSLTFEVKAVDSTVGTALTATVTITLPITNRLEFAKAKYGVCATDGATAGTAIATYVVADKATGDTVTYAVSGTDLAVGATTGALTVATGKTLNQATTGGYTVTITATAAGTTPSAVGTTDVWVAICSTTCSGVGHVTALIGVLLLGLLAACNI